MTTVAVYIPKQGLWVWNAAILFVYCEFDSNLTREYMDDRVIVNKGTSTETASIVFQDNSISHAEIGLIGNNNLQVKISADGSTWLNTVFVDQLTGEVTFPNTTLVAGKLDATPAAATPLASYTLIDIDTAVVEAGAPPFRGQYGGALFTDGGTPPSYWDHTFQLGFNMAAGGGRVNPAHPAFGIQWESKFRQSSTGPFGWEWHVRSRDTAGDEHRPISIFADHDGASGQLSFQADVYTIMDWDEVPRINLDFQSSTNGVMSLSNVALRYETNNQVTAFQRSAASTAYLALPYFTNQDTLAVTGPMAITTNGANPTTKAHLRLTAGNAAATQTLISGAVTGAVAGSFSSFAFSPACSGELLFNHTNNDVSGSLTAHSAIQASVNAGGLGDPLVRFTIGTLRWAMGLDNSDNDKFKISKSLNLGTNDRLVIDDNAVEFGLPARLKSYNVAGVPSAAAAGAGAMIYVSNESGGAVPAFSDGTDWRRVTDRNVIS